MTTIYKYPIPFEPNEYGAYELTLPAFSTILSAGVQGDKICIWAEIEVHDTALTVTKTIFVAGTGKELPDEAMVFINTVFNGPYVWHIYHS